MIDGDQRKAAILAALQQATKPISATSFAKKFGVSRQIVVGDVALLRASGATIIATARGYLLERESEKLISKLAVQHTPEQTEEELRTIIEQGGEVIDVVVEHPLYGELVGGLHLATVQDVATFIKEADSSGVTLLSELTAGIHLHTIAYESLEVLTKIKQALSEKGILYEENRHA
ncbi:transcription repressor NadR [Enterococcus xiangfangensis]|uniref:Transcription repressor NadR n=1 Tax=Enterococcus xiangfangensis TaxID=1296537 RepID=A0ABU3FBH0_9ENTE|nr:transcription repressor NadR [Enterococcus xiangfangensis]MDT2760014.1 transcription repressor NadR [Enterococcus xiangfangensis]